MSLSMTTTQSVVLSPQHERITRRRWRFWEPHVILWLTTQSALNWLLLDDLRARHAARLADLLGRRGIELRDIRRLALDDPREPEHLNRVRVNLHCDQRARRASASITATTSTFTQEPHP